MKKNYFNLVFLLAGGVFLAGCEAGSRTPVIQIGCAAPLTGDQAQLGLGMCQGVHLAVEQANAAGESVPGYKLEVLDFDDQHNPAQAVNGAKKFVADRDVVAVVGHFNSSCTKPASAVYHEAGMVSLTPASTNPELSRQGFQTFFRISATDDVQGPKGAQYAAKVLGVKNVFIIDDKTTYGKGLADEFEKEARKLDLEVLGHEGITQGDKDFTPLLTKIRPLAPELIYFGGIYPEGALMLREARSLDINSLFMGGDGLATPIFIELATPEIAEGTYATMVGGDMKKVPSAAAFIKDYEAKYGEISQWSAYGYDGANILIEAIKKAGVKDRTAVLRAMREIPHFTGVTGEVVFDEKGDNQNQFIGVFKVEQGKLVYIGPAE
ncbi:MAG TPA: branched-chain amino acid ABC transporter substrate-binding protein [bacterium]|nr:branched-chain amino acid ABC transporter substrate-binding protein [bacterium]